MQDRFALLRATAALFQVTFLHGALLLVLVDKKQLLRSRVLMVIYSFTLSLVVNYFLFFLVTSISIFLNLSSPIKPILYGLFVIEFGIFVKVAFKRPLLVYAATLALTAPLLVIAASQVIPDPILRIYICDETYSYGRWAGEWMDGSLPTRMNHYGQLVSTAWASVGLFLGDRTLAFIIKAMMPLFSLYAIGSIAILPRFLTERFYRIAAPILWVLLSLTIHQRSSIYAGRGAEAFTYFFSFTSMNIDMAINFFACLSFVSLLIARSRKDLDACKHYLKMAFLATVAAGVTKQGGMTVVLSLPIFAYLIVLKDRTDLSQKSKLAVSAALLGGGLLLVAPHYIYNQISVHRGTNHYGNLIDIQNRVNAIGPTPWSRIPPAFESLYPYFYGKIPLILLLVFSALGAILFQPLFIAFFVLVVPYTFIWMMYVSYEIPNLTLVIPYLALCASNGLWTSARFLQKRFFSSKLSAPRPLSLDTLPSSHRKMAMTLAGVIVAIFGLSFRFPSPALVEKQLKFEARHRPELNDHLVSEFFLKIGRIKDRPHGL